MSGQFSVGKNFELVAGRWHDRTALVVPGGPNYDYGELDDQVNAAASGLSARGVERGSRVALLFPNTPEFVIAHFALQKLGAVSVPLNHRLAGEEVAYILQDADVELLVYDEQFEDTVQTAQTDVDTVAAGTGAFEALLDNLTDAVPCPAERDDESFVAYTSGSTGRPKGVPHTHDDVILGAAQSIQEMSIQRSDRALHIAPLFHVVGLNCFFNPHWFMGATNILQPTFDPEEALELIEAEQVTGTLGVPAQIEALLRVPDIDQYDLSSLEYVRTGGGPITESTVVQARDQLAPQFYNTYGLTETQQNATAYTPDDPEEKRTSVGKASYFWDVRVVEPASPAEADPSREISPPGTGMVMISGPITMERYLNRPEATEEVFVDGWLYTGDVAELDEDGYMYIVDRMDNLIKSGGENIYPQEVEGVLSEHPAVVDCGVFAMDHNEWGETVTAAVVPAEDSVTADELDDDMRETDQLADFKRPRRYEFVEEIPRSTGSGSIQREALRSLTD